MENNKGNKVTNRATVANLQKQENDNDEIDNCQIYFISISHHDNKIDGKEKHNYENSNNSNQFKTRDVDNGHNIKKE